MKKHINILSAFLIVIIGIIFFVKVSHVNAAALFSISDTMSSVKIGNLANHEISFNTPTGIASGETVIITFPSGFSIPAGLTFADIDMNIGGRYVGSTTLASSPSGSIIGVARSGANVLTITNGADPIPPGSFVDIKIGTNAQYQTAGTFQITNDTTTGSKPIGITGSFGDVGTSSVYLVSDDSVQVLATVPLMLTFSISTNSIYFGSLSDAFAKFASSTNSLGDATNTEAHSLTISTNASAGYTITIQGQTLTSQENANHTITPNGAIPIASSPGSEQFGIYATKTGGGTSIISAPYASSTLFGYNASATTSAIFASASSVTAVEHVYHLHYIANISTLTEAGIYNTSITYIGTANF